MATRLGLPDERLEKLYAGLDAPARQATVAALLGRDNGSDDFLERILLAELRRPADVTTEQMRFEALVALGRVNGGLSNETLRALGTLVQAAATPPDLREAAHRLLETASARTPAGSD